MRYEVRFSGKALKALKRMDRQKARLIFAWVNKNLNGTDNPRQHGKALVANKKGFWRYRLGDYRLIAEIDDNEIRIDLIHVGHRSEVYDHLIKASVFSKPDK